MPEKTWLETRQKKTRWYVLLFIIAAIAGIAVFVRNNREMFFPKSDGTQQKTDISISDGPKSAPKKETKKGPADSDLKKQSASMAEAHIADTMAIKKAALDAGKQRVKNVPVTPAIARTASSVMIPDIKCALSDHGAFKVVLSLELFIADDSNKREILLKRENLKVMVQKVLAVKTLDELIVDSLRLETKAAMNAFLEKNMIIDVEFRNFRIDKVR